MLLDQSQKGDDFSSLSVVEIKTDFIRPVQAYKPEQPEKIGDTSVKSARTAIKPYVPSLRKASDPVPKIEINQIESSPEPMLSEGGDDGLRNSRKTSDEQLPVEFQRPQLNLNMFEGDTARRGETIEAD